MQNRGILITLRAAAIVIIVTGLNDVIASAVPRYEPLYLYLAAIGLVALTDGILLGTAAAILSIAFYALLFIPRPQLSTAALVIPGAAAIGVALAGAVIRGFVRSRRRKPQQVFAPMPPLLATSEVASVTDNAEVLAAIDELRNELRTAIGDRSVQERADAEWKLAEARDEAASKAGRLAELELELHEERATREKLEEEFDKKLQTIVTHLASDHEADLGQAMSEKEEARAEARALAVKLSVLQRKHDEDAGKLHDAETLIEKLRAAAREAPRPAARPRVMIVHPDADLRATASASLERAGYDVVIAETSMPKMDGRELCRLLKSQEKTAHIRVVLLMRASDEEPRGELPPDEILRKPVPVETLKATLTNLLARPVSSRA